MEDPIRFQHLLIALAPALALLWLWGLARVLRDLRRREAPGADLSRCGLPNRPLSPPPLLRWLARPRSLPPHGLLLR
ncbi:hypothetical protein KTR66_08855 [Roseococcus sp. SDR]|uniref:hypothetical protein n=1 Tax=Roseococcus sp. SDR TaxID=2835532 RepID=UPI001BCBDB4B|nr:hypothetical protein [Roseococcus sp. SDR]MBS7790102.1 hypothetical protein [Roseococcus sp. SDR]MBV1845416.1 hypothetical protein [Roseococcus sp. SDR]